MLLLDVFFKAKEFEIVFFIGIFTLYANNF